MAAQQPRVLEAHTVFAQGALQKGVSQLWGCFFMSFILCRFQAITTAHVYGLWWLLPHWAWWDPVIDMDTRSDLSLETLPASSGGGKESLLLLSFVFNTRDPLLKMPARRGSTLGFCHLVSSGLLSLALHLIRNRIKNRMRSSCCWHHPAEQWRTGHCSTCLMSAGLSAPGQVKNGFSSSSSW